MKEINANTDGCSLSLFGRVRGRSKSVFSGQGDNEEAARARSDTSFHYLFFFERICII